MDKKWFQEGNPASFKIQVLYHDIPAFVKTTAVDTPFRFSTYEDALTVGQDIFNGIKYRIVGSSDKPHWQSTPMERASPTERLKSRSWYDIYGVTPSRDQGHIFQPQQPPETLKKLKPGQSTEGVSKLATRAQQRQRSQAPQQRQRSQAPQQRQRSQGRQSMTA